MDKTNNLNIESVPYTETSLSHSDKLVGIISEPIKTFSQISCYPPKRIDWLIPVLIFIILTIASNIIMLNNQQIKYSLIEDQMGKIEKNFKALVESGKMTQGQAVSQLEEIRESIEENIDKNFVTQAVVTIFFTLITLFVVALIFYLITKFILKGEGTYSSALVAVGLSYYVYAIHVIVMIILALSFSKFFEDTSIATFLNVETSGFGTFLLGKVDIFSIWFYTVLSVGLAKIFKAKSTGVYFIVVYGLWLGSSSLLFLLSEAIPLLKFIVG